jgi:site-specific DNA-cytosine methylase
VKWKYDIVKRLENPNSKSNTITTVWWWNHEKKIFVSYAPWSREFFSNWWKEDKVPTICARDWKDPRVLYRMWKIRKLTPIEYERLQTLPDGYTEWVSDSQRYKMLGNWWTCDVVAHIFRFIK